MRRASRLHPVVVLAFLTVFGSGCSALRPGGHSEGVRLHVHNESWSAVTVTTSLDGDVVDLGTVHPDNYPFFDLDLPEGHDEIAVVVTAASAQGGEVRTDTLLAGRGAVLLLRLDRKPSVRSAAATAVARIRGTTIRFLEVDHGAAAVELDRLILLLRPADRAF